MSRFLASASRFLSGPVSQRDIIHYKSSIPGYRFEYHPKSKRVYIINILQGERTKQPVGKLIATDIGTEAIAYQCVLIWCRGYRAGNENLSHDDSGKLVLLNPYRT